MNIIVVGCGKIGTAVMSALVNEGHDVTVMDENPAVINEITNIYDVMAVCGNGADCETLEEASIQDCDIFVAVTGSDELNMLSCFIAKKMGAKHTVARIRNPEYNDRSLSFMRHQLELSMSINPELLMAQELHNLLKIPSAYKVEYFSRRNLEMIEVRLKKDSALAGKKISKIRDREKQHFLIGAVLRDNRLIIPDGNFELREGDTVSIVASPSDIQKLLKSLDMIKKAVKDVMIIGGSKTAFYLSKILSLLKQGKPVLLGAKNSSGGQHWVVVTGYTGAGLTESSFIINDPGSETRTNLQQFFNSFPNLYKFFWYD